MPDVIDAFVVSLGLDPTQYDREIKKYRDGRKQLDDEEAKSNRRREDAQTRLTDGVRRLRNETAGFLLMMAGANSVKDFATNILSGDAATNRMARSLGIATEQLGAWQGAIKDVGGQAADINKAFNAIVTAQQNAKLTGTTGHDADFQGLGITDLSDPQAVLLKIAEASSRMPRQEFGERLSRIGFDPYTIDLLARGRVEVAKLVEEQEALYKVTQENGDAAERFEKSLGRIERALAGKVRPELTKVVDGVGDWLEKGDNLNNTLSVFVGIVGAIAVATAVAYWPVTVLAGAIALMVANSEKLKGVWDDIQRNGLFTLKTEEGGPSMWDRITQGVDDMINEPWMSVKPDGGARGVGAAADSAFGVFNQMVRTGSPAGDGAAGGGSREEQAMAFFRSRGFSAVQARGIVAAMKAENGSLDPAAHNKAGGNLGAYGLGQWRGSRQAELKRRFGPRPTFQQQLQFMMDEMGGPDGGGSGVSVRAARTSQGAAKAMIDQFYRPGAGTAGDYARAGRYLGQPLASMRSGNTVLQTTSIGQINVYTNATNADGIARDMRGALANRGLVAQANTGLQP